MYALSSFCEHIEHGVADQLLVLLLLRALPCYSHPVPTPAPRPTFRLYQDSSMAGLNDGESSYETSSYGCHFRGRGHLLSEYEILRSHSFTSLYDFKEICEDFYTDLVEGDVEGKSQYLGFTHVSMGDIISIDEIRREIPKMTILYDSSEETLIVKFMLGVQGMCASILVSAFQRVIGNRTGVSFSVIPVRSARFRGLRRSKEADHAFKPISRNLVANWPSITFEVGVSQRLTQLQQEARFWLECSGGQTRIVIIACINKTARNMVIQRWQNAPQQQPAQNINAPNPYSRDCSPTLMQTLTLEEGQVYGGASLIIPAALIYDVLPPLQGAPFQSSDFEITGQMFNQLNEVFWRVS